MKMFTFITLASRLSTGMLCAYTESNNPIDKTEQHCE